MLDEATFTSARAKRSVVLDSVMKHAQTGKKPENKTVILDAKNGLLRDLCNGKKKRKKLL